VTLRTLMLSQAFDEVSRALTLRRPQRESLQKVHDWVTSTSNALAGMTPNERVFSFRESFPQTPEGARFPLGVFALATGVGKTRLMAALIAYLHRAGESTNYLILAPRRAILRQIVGQAQPEADKYLFSSEALVPRPRVWHADNLDRFGLPTEELELGFGPNVFVFSPQSFAGGDRRAARPSSDFADTSILDYLKSAEDLVVLVDEAHHVPSHANSERRAWSRLTEELAPLVQFGFTATPLEAERDLVLYEYDLAQCLAEGLYTKRVHVLAEQRPNSEAISDQDWDRRTIDFALRRLEQRVTEVSGARSRGIEFPAVNPVLLISAENTPQADEIYRWLTDDRGLPSEEVLITHSERNKTEEDLERLQSIDQQGSPVRVVVNVIELSEGWDVTNVYVIAPLRAMATFTNAVQTMGRGLRLPAGRRVGVPELDQLDVLCFGRQRFEEIVGEALGRFGTREGVGPSVVVEPASTEEEIDQTLVTVNVKAVAPIELSLPAFSLEPPEFDVSALSLDGNHVRSRNVVGFDLRRLELFSVEGGLTLSKEAFVRRTANLVIKRLSFLLPEDVTALEAHAASLVEPDDAGRVSIDPLFAAEHIATVIQDHFYRLPRSYAPIEGETAAAFVDFALDLPSGKSPSVPSTIDWVHSQHARRPIGPWRKCVHEFSLFDSGPELRLARLLDRSAAVDWWVRNDPARLKIKTPSGDYWPDFLTQVVFSGMARLVMIGVKGEHLWSDSNSEARIKAASAAAYARAVSEASDTKLEHWLVLAGDLEGCRTVEDVVSVVVDHGSFKMDL
jgi:superfamily II DNA or RNA helicase